MRWNQVIHGDALKLIERLDENSVDLIICDGPYGVTSEKWDRIRNIQEYNLHLIRLFSRVMKPGASLYLFGKDDCLDYVDHRPFLDLKRKIIWYQPSRLAQGRMNFTNNYDVIYYFTKGKAKTFDLDAVRVPQLVELEHRLRVEKVPSVKKGRFGKTKFNEKGKNPGDVWGDIKQLTYKSKELISREFLNTIQKPEKLIERLVKASSKKGDLVLDPFSGVGTTFAVCRRTNRNFIGFEINQKYIGITNNRVKKITPSSQE